MLTVLKTKMVHHVLGLYTEHMITLLSMHFIILLYWIIDVYLISGSKILKLETVLLMERYWMNLINHHRTIISSISRHIVQSFQRKSGIIISTKVIQSVLPKLIIRLPLYVIMPHILQGKHWKMVGFVHGDKNMKLLGWMWVITCRSRKQLWLEYAPRDILYRVFV